MGKFLCSVCYKELNSIQFHIYLNGVMKGTCENCATHKFFDSKLIEDGIPVLGEEEINKSNK